MIIRVEASSVDGVETARRDLAELTQAWGHPLAVDAAPEGNDSKRVDGTKTVDPLALVTLVLTIPSAALAVLDLADRIQKRRRASDLIEHAERLAAQHVTVVVMRHSQSIELAALTPDELLDLFADEPPSQE